MSGSRPGAGAEDIRGGAAIAPPVEVVERFGPAAEALRSYAELLATDGVARGLIGPREASRIWDRHILNSAALLPLLPQKGRVVDVGSGAGLPGLVVAILRPELEVTLVEPLLRRVRFLASCVDNLRLGNCRVVRGRAEELGSLRADVVVARAVAPLERLARISLPLLRSGGDLLAVKGANATEELRQAEPALRRFGASSWSVVRLRPPQAVAEATVIRVRTPERDENRDQRDRRAAGRLTGEKGRTAGGTSRGGHEGAKPEHLVGGQADSQRAAGKATAPPVRASMQSNRRRESGRRGS